MASSSVAIVKAALLTTIRARPNLSAIQVEWSHPGAKILKESIFMGPAQFTGETVSGLRPTPRKQDEEYTVPVWVSVLNEGDDAQTAETRMWALAAEVEEAVRAAPQLGLSLVDGNGLQWAVVAGKEPREFVEPQGRIAECNIAVQCRARI